MMSADNLNAALKRRSVEGARVHGSGAPAEPVGRSLPSASASRRLKSASLGNRAAFHF